MASSNNATDLLLWQSLDKELLSMVDTFGNLIKAATVLDEEVDPMTLGSSRERKAPGDLLEVIMHAKWPMCHSYYFHGP